MVQNDLPSSAEIQTGFEAPIEMVELSRDLYPAGSLGHTYFPEVLEGRVRPADFADTPLNQGSKAMQKLADGGIKTLADLMHTQEAELSLLLPRARSHVERVFRGSLEELTERYLVTPHGRMLGTIFASAQGPAEPADESSLREAVENALNYLKERERAVLKHRYGTDSWHPKTLQEVGKEFGVTLERARAIESKSIAKLRHPERISELKPFLTYPIGSVGRSMGITYEKDMPDLSIDVRGLDLSPAVIKHLESADLWYWVRSGAFRGLLTSTSFARSPELLEEVVAKVRQAVRQNEQSIVFGDLLPEVSVPSEVDGVAKNTSIRDLNLSPLALRELSDAGFYSLGSILDLKNEGYLQRLGPNVTHEIGTMAMILSSYLGDIVEASKD